jgi:peptidyl-prolyl cis-trans isomerase C
VPTIRSKSKYESTNKNNKLQIFLKGYATMSRLGKIATALCLVTLLASPGVWAQQQKDVLAKIGDRKITTTDLNRVIGFYDAEQQKMIEKNPQLKEAILWQIVQGLVISKVAKDKGFDKRPDIKGQQEMMVTNFLATQFMQKEVLDKVTITEAKVKAYYKDHQDAFKTPEMIRVRHILIKAAPPTATEEEKKAVKEKAQKVLERLKNGEDFAKVAAEVSDDPGTKDKGGDLDFFPKGSMIPAFEEAAFALKPGELSGVIETEYGYHIIKMEEKKEAVLEPYDKIKDKVKDQALQEMKKAAATEFVEKALKNAKVEIYPMAATKQPKK